MLMLRLELGRRLPVEPRSVRSRVSSSPMSQTILISKTLVLFWKISFAKFEHWEVIWFALVGVSTTGTVIELDDSLTGSLLVIGLTHTSRLELGFGQSLRPDLGTFPLGLLHMDWT